MRTNHLLTAATFLGAVTTLTFTSCKKDQAPIADFSFSGAGTVPVTVSFTNNSTGGEDFKWSFGDGTTSTDRSPRHEYTKSGTFNVSLTVTGKGGSTSAQKAVTLKAPTMALIKGVRVTQMPFTDPATSTAWDNNSGPDVYFKLFNELDNVLYTSSTLNNLAATDLPVAWNVTPAQLITSFSTTYKVRLYDQDTNDVPPNADDFMGGYQFTMEYFAGLGYPTIGTLYINGNTLKVDLLLDWQ